MNNVCYRKEFDEELCILSYSSYISYYKSLYVIIYEIFGNCDYMVSGLLFKI